MTINSRLALVVDITRARETAPVSTLLGFAPTYGTGALADAHNALPQVVRHRQIDWCMMSAGSPVMNNDLR